LSRRPLGFVKERKPIFGGLKNRKFQKLKLSTKFTIHSQTIQRLFPGCARRTISEKNQLGLFGSLCVATRQKDRARSKNKLNNGRSAAAHPGRGWQGGAAKKTAKENMTTQVKICGITSLDDAQAAAEAGADALGFVFYNNSPRYMTIPAVAGIFKKSPLNIMRVGVFVNSPADFIIRAVAECGLSLLQFHGDEPPEFCTQFGVMSMKAFRIRDAESLKELPKYSTDAWLLDACSSESLGGTGEKFNWNLAVEAQKFGRPIFLAGGLKPENVADAVRRVKPFGVDVASGVESSPGKKDRAKVQAFIRAVRSVE
jgi:phosphoribosylanthranilate isomerase